MASKTVEVTLHVAVDTEGKHAVGVGVSDAIEALDTPNPYRVIHVRLNVPLPTIVSLSGIVPPDGTATLTVQ